MCRAIDVAAYILNERGRLSGYQLQKLLYYCQAWCLVTQDRPLFNEEIRAWEHGPVVYEVARAHRGRRSLVASDNAGNPRELSVDDQVLIDAVLESYGTLSGDELEELSHTEDPWRSFFNGETGIASNSIPHEAMRSYYSKLMAADAQVQRAHHVPRFSVARRLYVSDDDFDYLSSLL